MFRGARVNVPLRQGADLFTHTSSNHADRRNTLTKVSVNSVSVSVFRRSMRVCEARVKLGQIPVEAGRLPRFRGTLD
jgi:hypothetical protein